MSHDYEKTIARIAKEEESYSKKTFIQRAKLTLLRAINLGITNSQYSVWDNGPQWAPVQDRLAGQISWHEQVLTKDGNADFYFVEIDGEEFEITIKRRRK